VKTATSPVRSKRAKSESDAFLAIVGTAEDLQRGFSELFKTHDLSPAQYNVLRILRGAGPDGLTCGGVSERLVQHDPDVTRLLDRLEKRALIERHRDQKDRRVVRTAITEGGLELLALLDGPVDALHEQQLGHLSDAKLSELTTLLEDARPKAP
jgi:MarR family transcriptional regulator, organic hydroperoxide resistance regulator